MFNIITDLPKYKIHLELRQINIRNDKDEIVYAKLKCPRSKPLMATMEVQDQVYLVVIGGKS